MRSYKTMHSKVHPNKRQGKITLITKQICGTQKIIKPHFFFSNNFTLFLQHILLKIQWIQSWGSSDMKREAKTATASM